MRNTRGEQEWLITYTNCPTRWRPSGLTPTHHQLVRILRCGAEHTNKVPAHRTLVKSSDGGHGDGGHGDGGHGDGGHHGE